jgi:excisionase family DNA binding protein
MQHPTAAPASQQSGEERSPSAARFRFHARFHVRVGADHGLVPLVLFPGNTWSQMRVYSVRHYHRLPAYDAARSPQGVLTMEQAAERLGVSSTVVRRLIQHKTIPATQVVPGAPWQIPAEALESELVLTAILDGKRRAGAERSPAGAELPMFVGLQG